MDTRCMLRRSAGACWLGPALVPPWSEPLCYQLGWSFLTTGGIFICQWRVPCRGLVIHDSSSYSSPLSVFNCQRYSWSSSSERSFRVLDFRWSYRVLTSVASISSCSQLIIPAISWPIVFTVFIGGLDLISTVQVVSHSQFYILEVFGCGWPPCIMVLAHLWDTQAFVAILYICYSAF